METHRDNSENQSCSLQDLSNELLLMIMDYLPYSSDFDFAITCKRFANLSHDVLKRHQDACTKYRFQSDLDPATVPFLLRSAFGDSDPLPAWHVRSFEVWTDREDWEDWYTIRFDDKGNLQPLTDDDARLADTLDEPSKHRRDAVDVHKYIRHLFGKTQLYYEGYGNGSNHLEVHLLGLVSEGKDGLLKALLFANCPRLRDLKFITAEQEDWSCLYALSRLIVTCTRSFRSHGGTEVYEGNSNDLNHQYASTDQEGVLWPVGLSSIRNVAVGVESSTYLTDDREATNADCFMHLLQLPNLNSIYYNKLRTEDPVLWEGDPQIIQDLLNTMIPVGRSSVKHIFLDGCGPLVDVVDDAIWSAPEQLITVAFRHKRRSPYMNAPRAVSRLIRSQGRSLESMMWYGYEDVDHFEYEDWEPSESQSMCLTFDRVNFDDLKRKTTIRTVSLYLWDIIETVRFSDEFCSKGVDVPGLMASLFPESIETLVLAGTSRFLGECPIEVEWLDLALARIITDGRHGNLKAIYLEGIEWLPKYAREPRCYAWFQYAMAAGEAAGVDVHTLTNRATKQHSISFIEAPRLYDLLTGPYRGMRPINQVFDPSIGYWKLPCCGRCGTCDNCLIQYRDFVWEGEGLIMAGLEDPNTKETCIRVW